MSSPNKYNLVFSPEAVNDRKDIVAYTVATWGEEQAEKYNQKIKEALTIISLTPRKGKAYPKLPVNCQIYHVERHYIV